jgi:hypothetical protein
MTDMETHTYGILAQDGRVIATTNVEGWCERHARPGETVARYLFGGWQPIG